MNMKIAIECILRKFNIFNLEIANKILNGEKGYLLSKSGREVSYEEIFKLAKDMEEINK